jgi:tRNA 2-thiouridine synthesizing protein A
MEGTRILDARGLSCPQPAMLTQKALESLTGGAVQVLVDSCTARDNVVRIARKAGWQADIQEQPDGGFQVMVTK